MRQQIPLSVVTYGLLTLAAFISFVLPDNLVAPSSAQAAGPAKIRVAGVVRDFQKTNPILSTAPSAGNGHYAGSVRVDMSSTERPVFAAGGYKVATQWRDMNARPIAPHMFRQPVPPVIECTLPPTISGAGTVLNTYSSWAGAYNPLTAGPAPSWATGSPMPAIPPHPVMPLSPDYLRTSGPAATYTINTSMRVSKFEVTNGNQIRINGNVTIVAEDLFKLSNAGHPTTGMELMPGSRLTIYAKKDFLIQDRGRINYPISGDPSRCTVYVTGTATATLQNQAWVCGTLIAPNALVTVQDGSEFYGRLTAKQVTLQNNAGIHVDTGRNYTCNTEINDALGTRGALSSGGITSASDFAKWFSDAAGNNLSAVHAIELMNNGSGVYSFSSNAFHPVDNMLYGNEGDAHNYYFTFALDTRFTYDQCSGQYFQFEGADDAWVFVNGKLVIDLGGRMPGTAQYVDMDRLKLTDGQVCTLHVFYAQRNGAVSRFNITTNIELQNEGVVYAVNGGVD